MTATTTSTIPAGGGAVQADNAKGVMDRFRSMPIAPSAVVLGRVIANMLYSVTSLVIMLGCGLLVGWRWHTGLSGLSLGMGLLLLLRLAMMWLGIVLGLEAKSGEMANGLFGLLYPITMPQRVRVARADARMARRHRDPQPALVDDDGGP